jgi:hypothetical protein
MAPTLQTFFEEGSNTQNLRTIDNFILVESDSMFGHTTPSPEDEHVRSCSGMLQLRSLGTASSIAPPPFNQWVC